MSLRIVLNAEGPGETRGALSLGAAPGSPLSEDELGPGHLLVRRVVAMTRAVPEEAISFLAPLRSGRGQVVRGSGLLNRTTLRQLHQWPMPDRRPDLSIVLVDADGQADRRTVLASHLEGVTLPAVIAVAVQEFESWLISDQGALNATVGSSTERPPAVESLKPRVAKALLADLLAKHEEPHAARCTIARTTDLALLERESSSFARFVLDCRV
jgi:hypothetical protein